MEEKSTEALLRELVGQQRRSLRLTRWMCALSTLLAAGVILALLLLLPRLNRLGGRVETLLSEAETLSARAGTLAEELEAWTQNNGQALTRTLQGLDAVDFQSLSEALEGLGEVDAESLSRTLRKLGELDVESLSGTIRRLSEIDFDSLNEAIQNLNDAVRPLAELARLLGGGNS